MRCLAVLRLALFATSVIHSQTEAGKPVTPAAPASALLSNNDALALLKRISQLMDSTMLATPGMVRAASPLAENVRQALANIQASSAQNSGEIYVLLANV